MREKPNYKIEAITYTKKFVGIDPKTGAKRYENVGEPKHNIIKENNFSDLKKKLYDSSKKDNNVFVNYENSKFFIKKVPLRIHSMTCKKSENEKTITYYKPVRKV